MIVCVMGYHGSGKSTVAKLLGLKIIRVDRIGRKAFASRKKEIKKLFGSLNKKKIRKEIFSNGKLLLKFNKIVHPVLIKILREELNKNKGKDLVIDAALYYDLRLSKLCDKTILVKKELSKIVKSLKEPRQEVEMIIKNQKIPKKADFVVVNNGSKDELKKKVNKIKKVL